MRTGIKDIETVISVLTPYWTKGSETLHFLMLRLSGYLASCGANEDQFAHVINELIVRMRNGQFRERIVRNAFRNSVARLKNGGTVAGLRSVEEMMEVI